MSKGTFIFDIDGTIADIEHRLHYIIGQGKDYRAFYAAVGGDEPIEDVIDLLRLLFLSGFKIIYITGRSDECRTATEEWLRKHVYHGNMKTPIELYMRRRGDRRSDVAVKMEIWYSLDKTIRDDVVGVFEDRDTVVKMWRALGVRCYQVKEGGY